MAAYIRTHPGSVPTVKQHLATIRALCRPVLTPAETRALLDRIDTGISPRRPPSGGR